MKNIFLAFFISCSGFYSYAQKQFAEGEITYKMSMSGGESSDQMTKSMIENAKMVQYIKGDKCRVNTDMGMMNTGVIVYGDGKRGNLLMDMMGQKYNVTMTEKDLNDKKSKVPKYTITQTNETKQICGYNCKKAIVKMENGETCNIFYTKDLKFKYKGFDHSEYEQIDGFPLEYEQSQNNAKYKYTITKIEEKTVNDDVFVVPADYKPMNMADFNKMMGGMGAGF